MLAQGIKTEKAVGKRIQFKIKMGGRHANATDKWFWKICKEEKVLHFN